MTPIKPPATSAKSIKLAACRCNGARRLKSVCGALPTLWLLLALGSLVACADKARPPPIPAELLDAAQVPGFSAVRQWGEPAAPADPARNHGLASRPAAGTNGPLIVLALSGGASNGTFGAGLLAGWSETGTRPRFHVVTGVSIGALAAPFAFLGSPYDGVLRKLFTGVAGQDVITPRPRLIALFSDSMASSGPLQALIEEHFNARLMKDIAAEHRAGRRLYVGTSHIYAGRQMVWDIGAIADSGRDDALPLIHRVLLASAAVPILLPPVFFEVEAGGQRYNEMHVDGGIMRQVFIAPPGLDWDAAARTHRTDGRIDFYVVRNGRVRSEYMVMQPKLLGLGEHAMAQTSQSLGIGDLHTIYLRAQRDGASFHAAWIDDSFTAPWTDWYDPAYASALFEHGRAQMLNAKAWHSMPPGIE
ncbi:MAG: patatin-like phospholipase family protein [Burkholderiaceae bacterium]